MFSSALTKGPMRRSEPMIREQRVDERPLAPRGSPAAPASGFCARLCLSRRGAAPARRRRAFAWRCAHAQGSVHSPTTTLYAHASQAHSADTVAGSNARTRRASRRGAAAARAVSCTWRARRASQTPAYGAVPVSIGLRTKDEKSTTPKTLVGPHLGRRCCRRWQRCVGRRPCSRDLGGAKRAQRRDCRRGAKRQRLPGR